MDKHDETETEAASPCVALLRPAGFLIGGMLVVIATLVFAGMLPYANRPMGDYMGMHKASMLNKCVLDSPRCWSRVFGAS